MTDDRFQTPMISCHAGHVFIGDFVKCYIQGGSLAIGKIKQYFMKVRMSKHDIKGGHRPRGCGEKTDNSCT
jgi:hypothetical protein